MRWWISLLLLPLFLGSAYAEKKELDRFDHILPAIEKMAGTIPAKDILVVFDLDDTLLTASCDLGGTRWFDWQAEKGGDFTTLLRKQGILYSMVKMVPVEPMVVSIVSKIQEKHSTMILTSRGPFFQYDTIRELYRNGLRFGDKTITYTPPKGEAFLPFEKGRLVSFFDGVYFTAGQHKGKMLTDLLNKSGFSPKGIVFIDDTEKHVDRVEKTFANRPTQTLSIHYTAVDRVRGDLTKRQKRKMEKRWSQMEQIVQAGDAEAFESYLRSVLLTSCR